MNNALTKGQRAVKRAFSSSDLVVLTMTFLTFFLATTGYFLVGFFLDETNNVTSSLVSLVFGLIGLAIVAVMFFGTALIIGMIIIKMQRQMMLGNALQIEYSAYAWLRDWANDVSHDLEMPRVEIFVTQDPVL